MALVELRTLGDCQIVVGDERIGPQSPFAFALTLYLAVERGRPHARDALLPLFFPGVAEANAAHSLRQTLYKLRQLGVPAETTRAGMILRGPDVRDDYSALVATSELPDPRAERLPGEFLPGYWPKISDDYTRWLEGQRDVVNSALRRALVSRILDRRAVARWDDVERFARACLAIDPLNEEATLALAEALALTGSKAAGVKLLERYLEEVGEASQSLTLPAAILKRRIGERLPPTSPNQEPGFVGRDSELRTLNHLLGSSLAGAKEFVWISGEPGIGKTRLLTEFVNIVRLGGVRVLSTSCEPHDTRRPLSVFADLADGLMTLPGSLGCKPHALELISRIRHQRHVDDNVFAGGAAPIQDLRDRLGGAFCDVIEAVASECALCLAIDDAAWMDTLSQDVLHRVFSSRAPTRLLVIVVSNEPPTHPAAGNTISCHIHLRGLDRTSATELVHRFAATGSSHLSDVLVNRAVAVGGGNPLFLRHLAAHYVDHHDTAELPIRLRDILERRVASLTPTAVTVLCTCALLGHATSAAVIERALQLPRHALIVALASLESQRLVSSSADTIQITHRSIADTALAAQSDAVRQMLRRALAAALEEEAGKLGDRSLYWTAHHLWTSAGDEIRATSCLQECALDNELLDAAVDTVLEAVDCGSSASGTSASERRSAFTVSSDTQDDGGEVNRSNSGKTYPPAGRVPPRQEVERWIYAGNDRTDERWLDAVIRDSRQAAPDRVRAAMALIAIAEFTANPELAHSAFKIAEAAGLLTDDRHPDCVRTLLAYHTVFGDEPTALAVARGAAAVSKDALRSRDELRNVTNAIEALTKLGRLSESLTVCETVFALDAGGADGRRDLVAINGAWMSRQLGDQASIAKWRERYLASASDPSGPFYASYLYSEALLATDAGYWTEVDVLAGQLAAHLPPGHKYHHRSLVEALRLQSNVGLRRTALDLDVVDRLASWCLRSAAISAHDEVAIAVVRALNHGRGPAHAQSFAREYLQRRRTGTYPVLPTLRTLCCALSAEVGSPIAL